MNLYKYWLKVKTLYPKATGDCVAYFRYHYRQEWKDHFKEPDEILGWLEKRHIHILTRKKLENPRSDAVPSAWPGTIRFELKSPEENTVTSFRFTDREPALYDAIERAFRILEQRELRRKAQGAEPSGRWRKSKTGPSSGPSWGEQLKK
jgi:hypothetical protein